jgi:hypothetical protein
MTQSLDDGEHREFSAIHKKSDAIIGNARKKKKCVRRRKRDLFFSPLLKTTETYSPFEVEETVERHKQV